MSGAICWRTRSSYIELIRWALGLHPDPLTLRPAGADGPARVRWGCVETVSEQTFLDWLDLETSLADVATGRNVIQPTGRIARLLGCSVRTVQRCRRIARENLGIYLTAFEGRQLTLNERLHAHERNSKQRGLANVSAFVVPYWLLEEVVARNAAAARAADQAAETAAEANVDFSTGEVLSDPLPVSDLANVAPPVGTLESNYVRVSSGFSGSSHSNHGEGPGSFSPSATAAASRPAPEGRGRRSPARRTAHGRVRGNDCRRPRERSRWRSGRVHRGDELARELIASQHLPWMPADLHPRRIGPLLARYENRGWSAADLAGRVNEKRKRLGYRVPVRRRRTPWGLLRWMLSDIDPDNDHPRLEPAYASRSDASFEGSCGSCGPSRRLEHPETGADLGPCPRCHPSTQPDGAPDPAPGPVLG